MKYFRLPQILLIILVWAYVAEFTTAQTVTIVGTPHLQGLETSPTQEQYDHTIERLSAFSPTQVCVERMGGSRIQTLAEDPMRNAMTFNPETHGRPLGNIIIPLGVEMQARLGVLPADAREQASRFAKRWDDLSPEERINTVALQIAGYEFHSAVLNWSYLEPQTNDAAAHSILKPAAGALDEMVSLDHEAYALAIPIARRAGLHELCTADSLEYETAGMQAATAFGGQEILQQPDLSAHFDNYMQTVHSNWKPDSGSDALTRMLAYTNSDEYAEFDRENQWERLLQADNDAGAFRRRLMFWHARTAQISSELYKALAQGRDERVMLIIGAAHRPFNEAEMRSQPWLTVDPASNLLSHPSLPSD